jgi:hypothetical protein
LSDRPQWMHLMTESRSSALQCGQSFMHWIST